MQNEVLNCLFNRKSIREFEDRPIDDQTLDLLLQATCAAPSAGNLQNYAIVMVTDKDRKAELNKLCLMQPCIDSAPAAFVFLVDCRRLNRYAEIKDGSGHFTNVSNYLLHASDAAIAAQNMVIAAECLGLGSVYIGSILNRTEEVIEFFDLPQHVFPAAMLSVGWPDEDPEPRPRLPLEAVLHHETYGEHSDVALEGLYRDRNENFMRRLKNDERRISLCEGIGEVNYAKYVTLAHYTQEKMVTRNKTLQEGLKKAGFME